MWGAIGIVVLCFVILYMAVAVSSRKTESDMMKGFWCADAEFCRRAELDSMIIYMGDGDAMNTIRRGYIFATNADGIILNNPVKFKLGGKTEWKPTRCDCREYVVDIDWLDESPPAHFPSQQDLYYYPNLGKMIFSIEDEINAVVYKDHVMSDVKNRMPSKLDTGKAMDDVGEAI